MEEFEKEKSEKESFEKESKQEKGNLLVVISIILGVIVALFLIVSTLIVNYSKIYAGVKVNGVKVGGLTELEATRVLEEHYINLDDIDIYLYCDEDDAAFKAGDVNAEFNSKEAAKLAFNIGREGNFLKKAIVGLGSSLFSDELKYDVTVDAKKFDKQISVIATELGNEVVQPSYVRQGDKLVVNTGTTGVKIDHAVVRQNTINELNYLKDANIEIEMIRVSPEKVDIEKIQNAIKQNVQDAEYISDTGVLVDQIIGIEIEDIEEAKKIAESVTEEGMQFAIKLKITLPEVTTDEVLNELFKDKLSTFTTTYKVSEKERSENVRLAADALNNVILMPGQEFSYNNTVGERTTERGYKVAKVYQGGTVVDGLGGGVCQVSSTLYNAVIKADLEILERRNHSLSVSYVKLGTDATVSYGSVDFRFRNNQQYPIRIKSNASNGNLTIDIEGVQTNPNRSVSLETETVAVLNYTEKIIEDASLPMGTSSIVQSGKKGYKINVYRVTKENGKVIERKLISTDTYSPIAQIKKVALTETSGTPVEVGI